MSPQACKHKCSFPSDAQWRLAEHIHAETGLGEAFKLHLGRATDATIDNSSQQFWLQEEAAEAGGF